MEEKIIISPARFMNGGAAILLAAKINHQMAILGRIVIWPLVIKILRVFVIENVMPASANKADEHSPWVVIVIYAPVHPHFVIVNIAVSVILMWATDEYAISALKSVCRAVRRVVMAAPQDVIANIAGVIGCISRGKEDNIRKSPYTPSFSRSAAKIIDPAVGASTWAFGSHKCTE